MATNLIAVNVYQINQKVQPNTGAVNASNTKMYLPSTGLIVQEVGLSNTNPLSTGVFVYASIQVTGTGGTLFYTGLHASEVQTLANA